MLMENKGKCANKHPNFVYDEACLDIHNYLEGNVSVYGQYVECNKCEYQWLCNVTANNTHSLLINTKYSMRMHYVHNNATCDWNQELLEHYRYQWNLTEQCTHPYIVEEADNAYIPILTAFITLFFIGTIWYMIKCIYKCTRNNVVWRRFTWNSTEIESDLGSTTETPLVIERPPAIKKHPNRIKSLDVFRGFCIMVMIFVNYGGGQYWFFQHSVWNGVTIADLVFPWFLWLMGFSMSISFLNKLRNAMPRRQLVFHVIRRSLILFALGIVLNSHGHEKPLSSLRIFGVLQRIAITYLIVGLMEAAFARRINEYPATFWGKLTLAWPQNLIVLCFLVVHTCVTFLADVPGCGRGYMGPGGLDDGGKHENCTGGVAGYIDRQVLGRHIYKAGSYKTIYETSVNFDPEGILGILTSSFLVYLGVQAGRILQTYPNIKLRTTRWLACGISYGLFAGALCKFSKNDGFIPINKRMWSLSFVMAMGGAAYVIFAFLFVVVDITRKWGGRPFFYAGMNPLVIYILHEMFRNTFPVSWVPTAATHGAYLFMNLWGTFFWVCFAIVLYKKNVFISI